MSYLSNSFQEIYSYRYCKENLYTQKMFVEGKKKIRGRTYVLIYAESNFTPQLDDLLKKHQLALYEAYECELMIVSYTDKRFIMKKENSRMYFNEQNLCEKLEKRYITGKTPSDIITHSFTIASYLDFFYYMDSQDVLHDETDEKKWQVLDELVEYHSGGEGDSIEITFDCYMNEKADF